MSDFGKEVRDLWDEAEEADKDNRKEALADLAFAAGEHWDEAVREYRERVGRERYGCPLPCLTVNNMPALIGQVTGDRRANEVAAKVLPNEAGDKETADVRSEIIRSIEVRSKAQRTYLASFGAMVNCGISNFRVDLDYAYDDVFERDIFIRPIPNPMAVLWDPLAADPTGRDAEHCFVVDRLTKEDFKARFKDAPESGFDAEELRGNGWVEDNKMRVVEYWKMIEKKRTIAMLQVGNGADPVTEDVTDRPEKEWKPRLVINPTTGKPMLREAPRKFARMVMTNGLEELTDPFELPLCRVPIIRVSGQEIWVGDKRERFGLVRFARDPARLKDYMRSVIAEKLMLATRANIMGPASAFEGREKDYPNILVYNDRASAPPTEITGNNLVAMANEAQWYAEDIKDVTGLFDASRGMKSNETSGVAIENRQREGDIATIVYHDSMDSSQQEAGEVVNDLLPLAYDTPRTLRLIGANEAVKFLRVNDPNDPDSIDLSKGRYDVTISTGPAYATRRLEGSAQLMELAGKSPQLIEIAGDKIIESLDLVDGDEIAARVKRAIPPQILGDEADDNMSDEEKAQKQQAAQQAQQKQDALEQVQFEGLQAETALKVAQAKKAEAEAMKAQAEAAAAGQGEAPDPIAHDKNRIAAYDAQTRRLSALGKGDFELPPEAAAMIAPAVTQAVMHVLGLNAVTPALAVEIGAASMRDAAEEKDAAARAEQRDAAQAQAKTQPPQEGAQQ